ncbi:MAG: ATP-binding cassette domain-containing protein [Flavobacteriales bacterium]|nr:ATP-binding cassette domain-containing protein [Flavobacteriales bacterium]MBT4737728.1 ATP-binding cassette domain-containing protein [Flavobacteriales bacterium]MBT6699228.1 ATP-binding cassette domain-containing protein [Flavobacteriales bacterium]MDG2059310.1 ATP-binding cassette domain-containing protein [Flavobacteriales bacterium]
MIEVKNIHKKFGDNLVLNDVSFNFQRGKTNLIIGESGSGKTTLLKILIGLYPFDKGVISYDGRIFNEMKLKEKRLIRQEIGMLFQGGALFDYMTVEENIKFPLTMFTNQTEEEKIERVNFCLKRVNLENQNNLLPSALSGGMVKRVAIARSISMNPRYLLCDEPNSGLDPKTAILIDDLIKEITEEYNITTIVNTHDMNSVMQIGDNIAFIHNGEIWWEGNKEELIHAENKELHDFVFASKLFKRLKRNS